jgi:hypothetical protein
MDLIGRIVLFFVLLIVFAGTSFYISVILGSREAVSWYHWLLLFCSFLGVVRLMYFFAPGKKRDFIK